MAKTNIFRVAGTSYRQDALRQIVYENEDYNMSKKQLIDADLSDDRIYEFDYHSKNVELVPEPDNEHDPNAIKVLTNGVHIGYIEASKTSTVRDLIDSGKIDHMSVIAEGGRYKYVTEDDDGDYRLEEGTANLFADLYIVIAGEPENSKVTDNKTNGMKILIKVLVVILAAMSLLLSLVYPLMLLVVAACIVFVIKWK